MSIVIYVGMDVHTTNYTLSCYTVENDTDFANVQMEPSVDKVKKYLDKIKANYGGNCQFVLGYEAGCLGYSLQRVLAAMGYECKILAPTTIPSAARERKTDRRDAKKLARCLAYNTAKYVYIPTKEDEAVKDYVRMVEDRKNAQKIVKQQLNHLCIRYGKFFDEGSHWTKKHEAWLQKLDLGNQIANEALQEYLDEYFKGKDKIDDFMKRIDELAMQDAYEEKVSKLRCIKGIDTYTALSLVVEVGDFNRFSTAGKFAAFLGLVPGEHSSSTDINRLGITKAGNKHLRKLLTESSQSYRGMNYKKSAALKNRQEGNDPKVISYADKAAERLTKKFHHMYYKDQKKWNMCVAATAREMSCFVWGMMTDHMDA